MSLGGSTGAARGDYILSASNITTEPALIAEPMRFSLKRTAATSDVRTIEVTGTLDHRGPRASDVVNLRAAGVPCTMLDDRGQPVVTVVLPRRTELVQAKRGMIWAVHRSSDDVPSVVRYRVGTPG